MPVRAFRAAVEASPDRAETTPVTGPRRGAPPRGDSLEPGGDGTLAPGFSSRYRLCGADHHAGRRPHLLMPAWGVKESQTTSPCPNVVAPGSPVSATTLMPGAGPASFSGVDVVAFSRRSYPSPLASLRIPPGPPRAAHLEANPPGRPHCWDGLRDADGQLSSPLCDVRFAPMRFLLL